MIPALHADPRRELSGAQVRRFTRSATAARASTSLLARIGDAVGTLTSIAVGVAVIGGTLASLRHRIVTAVPPVGSHPLPVAGSVAVLALLALAGLVVVLDRLGPVNSTPAAAAWWLPLPAGRRGLLRGELIRMAGVVAVTAVLLALPVVLGAPASPTPAAVLAGLGWVAGAALLALGGTGVLQTRGRSGRLASVAGTAAVAVALLGAAAATATAAGWWVPPSRAVPASPTWAAAVLLAIAALLLLLAVAGLDRLGAAQLRAGGRTAQYATASVLSLDTRDLGRALAGRASPPRRPWRFGWVGRPEAAVVAGDLAILSRGRWQLGQLATAVAIPAVAAHTRGLGRLPWLVWGGCLLGWSLAAVAAGLPARSAQAAPVLDRMLPLSAPAVVTVRAAVPLAATAAVCGGSGLLVGVGTGAALEWGLLGLAVAPVWAAAAVRAAYRPEPDWSGELLATPMGPVPSGVGATLVQGVDAGVLGSLPVLFALLHGTPTAGTVTVQLAWSVCVAAAAMARLRRRGATQPR